MTKLALDICMAGKYSYQTHSRAAGSRTESLFSFGKSRLLLLRYRWHVWKASLAAGSRVKRRKKRLRGPLLDLQSSIAPGAALILHVLLLTEQ